MPLARNVGLTVAYLRSASRDFSRKLPETGFFRGYARCGPVSGCWSTTAAGPPGCFPVMPRRLASDVRDWSSFTSTPASLT